MPGTGRMLYTMSNIAGLRTFVRICAVMMLALVGFGCAVPVASGLEDTDANRIVVAFDHAGVDAVKEADPGGEGKWRVTVSHDDVPVALGVLRDQELPRASPAGVLDAVGKGSLVPSEGAEHAQLIAGMGGDLERTLEGVDGVLSARVHLNLPVQGPMRETPTARATAGVLLEYSGATPPIASENVQRLVAGACSGLAPADVAVVMVSRPAPVRASSTEITHVGPFAVTRATSRLLTGVLVSALVVASTLLLGVLFLGRKLGQQSAELRNLQAAMPPAGSVRR